MPGFTPKISTLKRWRLIIDELRSLLHLNQTLRFEARMHELDRSLLEWRGHGVCDERVNGRELVVSLTSYADRLDTVYLTIESLMRQTRLPNRLVLWLPDSLRDIPLPAALSMQTHRGLEVRYTQDIKSYKKLIPSLAAFPHSLIVTVDDDILYDPNMLDRLVRTHMQFPHCVVTNKAIRLEKPDDFSTRRDVADYLQPDVNLIAMGGTGTLYPPGALSPEVRNVEKATRIAPTADDLWFHFMARINGTKTVRCLTPDTFGVDFIHDMRVQNHNSLWHANINLGGNNRQYAALLKAYPF